MQNIVLRLTNLDTPIPENVHEFTPWLDLRLPPIEVQKPILEKCPFRRQLKTHLPLDALKFSPKAKYIYIGRDGRDCYMSLINHYRNCNEIWYQTINGSPGKCMMPEAISHMIY